LIGFVEPTAQMTLEAGTAAVALRKDLSTVGLGTRLRPVTVLRS
jgi:hypothetical protein